MAWQSAERVQKNDQGQFRALQNGQWVPVSKAQKNDQGQYRVWVDEPAAPKQPSVPQRSLGGALLEGVTNIPSSFENVIGGVAEAVTHPVQTVMGIRSAATGGLRKILPESANALLDKSLAYSLNPMDWFLATPEGKAQTEAAANAIGGFYKDRYGSYQGFKNALATDPVGVAADVSSVLSGGAGIAKIGGMGRVAGALQRGAELTNPLAPVAAVATSKPVLGVVKAIPRGVQRMMVGPKANLLLSAAEGRGQDIVDILRGNVELVPGSMPTAGEAAAPLGVTRYSALQETATRKVPETVSDYFARGEQQEAARVGAVRGVGKTPAALATAKAERGAEADRLYGLAKRALVESDPKLATLLDRPSMNKAFDVAAKLAREAGDDFVIGKNVPEQVVPSKILDEAGLPVSETVIPAQSAEYPVKSLHYVKMALDDMLDPNAVKPLAKVERDKLIATRNEFLNWLESNVPDYKVAREAFAEASKPINQMEVGQYLEGKLTGALGQERAAPFATALKEAPTTLKKATGAPRFTDLSQVLTPQQLKAVEAVKADLQRSELFKQQTRAASEVGPTATRAGTEQAASIVGTATPSMLSRIQTVANYILKRRITGVNNKIAIQIATEMLDPKLAATAMEIALKRKAKVAAIGEKIKRASASTVNALTNHPALAAGQVTNALSE